MTRTELASLLHVLARQNADVREMLADYGVGDTTDTAKLRVAAEALEVLALTVMENGRTE